MPAECSEKCKPRTSTVPYKYHSQQKLVDKDSPKTTAKPIMKRKENLMLHDWMTVFAFINKHPGISQDAIVNHFKHCTEGVLIFDQSTLSQKLKNRLVLEA